MFSCLISDVPAWLLLRFLPFNSCVLEIWPRTENAGHLFSQGLGARGTDSMSLLRAMQHYF